MNFTEELKWRGYLNQTTYPDISILDNKPVTFYWGVDPTADSMTVGNLASAMMVKTFIKHGHKAVLLVGGATGLVGDPDGKSIERQLLTTEKLSENKQAIIKQYNQLFGHDKFNQVDNYDWFKELNYLEFLRQVGKHVPTRQMLSRDFVQSRLGEHGSGISYAEFSYVLIQAYDFLHLYENMDVTLQVCGSDQWGNSIAGVDLIRRKTGKHAHVLSTPLILNPVTGQKFGKTENGAIWLDPLKTTPTQFYQFWINTDDNSVESFLKIFTEIESAELDSLMTEAKSNPEKRLAQIKLANAVTTLVHGDNATNIAVAITEIMTGKQNIGQAEINVVENIRLELSTNKTTSTGSIIETLVKTGLASSNTDARRFIKENAISINGNKIQRENFIADDFQNGRLMIRRGKAFKDSALIELG